MPEQIGLGGALPPRLETGEDLPELRMQRRLGQLPCLDVGSQTAEPATLALAPIVDNRFRRSIRQRQLDRAHRAVGITKALCLIQSDFRSGVGLSSREASTTMSALLSVHGTLVFSSCRQFSERHRSFCRAASMIRSRIWSRIGIDVAKLSLTNCEQPGSKVSPALKPSRALFRKNWNAAADRPSSRQSSQAR